MPSVPRATFMVIKTQFFFQLFIAMLYPITFMVEPGKVNRCQVLRHITEEVAKLVSISFKGATLYQQPDLFMMIALLPSAGRPDSH